jgi:ElaB/YqjD/DUF883 family membrane-anchored ribosome-binding protein
VLAHSKQLQAHVRRSQKIGSATDGQSLAQRRIFVGLFALSDVRVWTRKNREATHRRNPEDAKTASESESEQKIGESSSTFVDEAARKTDSAIRNAGQKYVGRGVAREVETTIRDNPLVTMTIAAAAGFVVGGGMASPPGLVHSRVAWAQSCSGSGGQLRRPDGTGRNALTTYSANSLTVAFREITPTVLRSQKSVPASE